jgi:L-ascorbate metabolism protein UlaG (beta-lactamase superfamily)
MIAATRMAMHGWQKGLAIAFAALVVLVGFVVLALPRLLDRTYYQGPPSDHFDGAHFFNPDDRRAGAMAQRGFSFLRLARFAAGMERVAWPKNVPVHPSMPSRRVAGEAMRVTWIGHSTVLIQTQGLNILTDPIWSERASPVSFAGPKRVRAPGVAFDALPPIDLVLVSHAHYDHLDLPTLRRLWARDRPRIVVPLGIDAILRGAGIPSIARDWGQHVAIAPHVALTLERVHHWSNRTGPDRNRALWTGFTIRLPGGNLFFAGDTGLGDGGWVRDAARDGPYRLALIPIGAYLPREMMAPSHIGPSDAARIFRDLGAAYGLGVHWGTFQLSAEGFDDPPRTLAASLAADGIGAGRFRTPPPGEAWNVPALVRSGGSSH